MKFVIFLLLFSFSVFAEKEFIGIDVRSSFERALMNAPGSIAISVGDMSAKEMNDIVPDKSKPIKVFCAAGVRAEQAKRVLNNLGYKNVENIRTYKKWNELNLKK